MRVSATIANWAEEDTTQRTATHTMHPDIGIGKTEVYSKESIYEKQEERPKEDACSKFRRNEDQRFNDESLLIKDLRQTEEKG